MRIHNSVVTRNIDVCKLFVTYHCITYKSCTLFPNGLTTRRCVNIACTVRRALVRRRVASENQSLHKEYVTTVRRIRVFFFFSSHLSRKKKLTSTSTSESVNTSPTLFAARVEKFRYYCDCYRCCCCCRTHCDRDDYTEL